MSYWNKRTDTKDKIYNALHGNTPFGLNVSFYVILDEDGYLVTGIPLSEMVYTLH